MQVLKLEKKLRVNSLLGLKSAQYGEIKFNFEQLNDTTNDYVSQNVDLDPKEIALFNELFDEILNNFFNKNYDDCCKIIAS